MPRFLTSQPRSAGLVVALLICGACRALTESDDERRCRTLNAFTPDAAQMRLGETRRFEAAGSQYAGIGVCSGTIKGGFRYSTDDPAVAAVDATTGLATARAVGRTTLRAVWRRDTGVYRGALTLDVVP